MYHVQRLLSHHVEPHLCEIHHVQYCYHLFRDHLVEGNCWYMGCPIGRTDYHRLERVHQDTLDSSRERRHLVLQKPVDCIVGAVYRGCTLRNPLGVAFPRHMHEVRYCPVHPVVENVILDRHYPAHLVVDGTPLVAWSAADLVALAVPFVAVDSAAETVAAAVLRKPFAATLPERRLVQLFATNVLLPFQVLQMVDQRPFFNFIYNVPVHDCLI